MDETVINSPKDIEAEPTDERLTYELRDLAETQDLDILIIGSGPAAVAVVEHLYPISTARIGVLERGGILTTTHISNMLREGNCSRAGPSVSLGSTT